MVSDASESAALDTTAIIGIAVGAAVLVIIVVAISAFCCYKKVMHNKSKTHVEVVTVQKSRSEKKDYQRASKIDDKNEDCPKVMTDEEDISEQFAANLPMTETDAELAA